MVPAKISKHILVVEDDSSVALVLKTRLQSMGHRVTVEGTGKRGLAAAADGRVPDLIILDLMLPDMSGFDVCTELRRVHGPWIPILMLTALDQPREQMKGFACGADAYLTKPYNPPDLLKTVSLLLGGASPVPVTAPPASTGAFDRSFLGVEEAAKHFGVNATTIYRLARKGRIPGFKIGSQWRFSFEALQAWMAERRPGEGEKT